MKTTIKTNLKKLFKRVKAMLYRVPYIAALSYSFAFVLLIFRNHIFNIPLGEVFIPLVLSLLLIHISYIIFLWIIKEANAAGLMTFLLAVFMTQFEFIFVKSAGALKSIFPVKSSYDVFLVIVLTLGSLIALGAVGIYIKKWPILVANARKFFDASVGVYFLIALISIAFLITANHRIFLFDGTRDNDVTLAGNERPDIYYFVFDRYASEDTLNKYYDFSNVNFIEQMKSRGFVFNDTIYSNYPYTATSLASTLNQDYLGSEFTNLPPKYSETIYNEMIDGSSGINTLQANGYEYHHVGSWWGATRTSNSADISYTEPFEISILGFKFVVSDFQDQLLRSHIIRRVLAADIPIISKIVHYEQPTQREIVSYQFNSVKQIVDKSSQTDVVSFFHVLSPHPQYVFDKNGEVPPYHQDAGYGDVPEKIKYINQLEYINTQILNTIDYILANSEKPPIIIFQPDEGPYRYKDIDDSSLSRADKMRWKYGVTSAFYLPGYEEKKIELSPVNIFPYIFNSYFGADIELQENSNYWYNNKDPYNFQDITDLLNQ